MSLNKAAIFLVLILSLSTLAISEQQVFATKSNTEDNSTGTVDGGTAPDVANEGPTPGGGTAPAGNEGTTPPQGNEGVAPNDTDTATTTEGGPIVCVRAPCPTDGTTTGGPLPNGTGGLNVSGNCNAVALSNATNNSSSASSAAVTCNNSVVNKNIYQQRITQTLPQIQSAIANKGPIIQSDSMKLGQGQSIGSNNVIVVGDFSPFRIVGGHISANLPKGNNTQIVVGEISTTGVLSKAVPLPLVKAWDLTINNALYTTDLGNIVQGRDIFNGSTVTINSPNIIMLYNVGKVVIFSGANTVAYTAIIA
ncbi:MAG: hypothetical protein ACJ72V_12465 [Nitrososphaeraceae archaeon]